MNNKTQYQAVYDAIRTTFGGDDESVIRAQIDAIYTEARNDGRGILNAIELTEVEALYSILDDYSNPNLYSDIVGRSGVIISD